MAKIYCDDCDGIGIAWHAEYIGDEYQGDESTECLSCGGQGYTEQSVVLIASVEAIVEYAFLHKNNMSGMRRKILDALRELDQIEQDKDEVQDEI